HDGPPQAAAVLLLLYPQDGRLFFPLTKRTERVANHKGQISLPGGALEEGDRTLWDTALREAYEEVGVDPGAVEYIGQLTPLYIPASHYTVTPFVGYAPFKPLFVARAEEVAEIIEMPLDLLLDAEAKGKETRMMQGRLTQVPYYAYRGHVIWGATAMILAELETLLHEEPVAPVDGP
ncbi:MAG: CoA pyrophosphatase, partial [Chloroflexi bacterium]|nr:CoA pyrophosphatase [Chloroflexota bacterium]